MPADHWRTFFAMRFRFRTSFASATMDATTSSVAISIAARRVRRILATSRSLDVIHTSLSSRLTSMSIAGPGELPT